MSTLLSHPGFAFCVFALLYWIVRIVFESRPRRKYEPMFYYVYIGVGGSARELDAEEREYLNTKFSGFDGGRPYIKSYYEALTPDKKLHGYLSRRQLPAYMAVRPIVQLTIEDDFVWVEAYEAETEGRSENRIKIPLSHIKSLDKYSRPSLFPQGRFVPVEFPRPPFTTYQYRGETILWLASNPDSTLVIGLVDEPYDKIVVEVADIIRTERRVYGAILDHGLTLAN